MKSQSDRAPNKSLRDAYQVCGFRMKARIDSYEELEHPAFVLTLDRRSKKRCAAGAGRFVAAFTTSGGAGRVTSAAAIGRSISIFLCAAWTVRPAA
jgi:hypothetical protein